MNREAEHISEARTHLTERQEHHITRRLARPFKEQIRRLEKQRPEQVSGFAAGGAE